MRCSCKHNFKSLAVLMGVLCLPIYAIETLTEPRTIVRFKPAINESSALASQGKHLWTLNDSGNGPYIFKFDKNGNELGSYRIANTANSDWESLASDNKFLYIGDIGNNFNRRKALTIYRLAWKDIEQSYLPVDRITFMYADHKQGLPISHDFDAEAIAIHNEEIWLFTKNRGNGNSNLYRFPKVPGRYLPEPTQVLPMNSLVTAADIHPKTGYLAMLSTKKTPEGGKTLLWLAPTSEDGVEWASHKSIEISPHDQWEAVVWDDQTGDIFLTHENNERGYAGLAKLSGEILNIQ